MTPERLKELTRIHREHVEADGQHGHTAKDEWRNCTHHKCVAVRHPHQEVSRG